MPLTPADIRDKKFHTVRLRPGYDEEEVDTLLDRIESTLVALEGGPRTSPLITAEEVRNSRFQSSRWRPGYRADEVDDFLDIVVADLESRGLWRPGPVTPPLPPRPEEGVGADGAPMPGLTAGGRQRRPEPPLHLTPEQVRDQRFATTRLTTGYNEREVDDFLDRAEFTLEAFRSGRPDRATLSSQEVERVQFSTTRARPGYDPEQVDRFLDVLAEELRRHERR